MTGLFIALDDYVVNPIEEDITRANNEVIEEDYYFIPSISNMKGWEKLMPTPENMRRIAQRERANCASRDSKGRFIRQ